METYSMDHLWMIVLGFLIAFVLAFGIGANDVANSFGTSVGSGVLTLKQACILATVCEISGAVLIGYKVSDTMRKGILEVSLYQGAETELMLGCVAALASSAIWLLIATFLKLPISGTHSIVGSTIGFSLVAQGTNGLKWSTLGTIVGSWFISPILSGCVSILLYMGIRKFILNAKKPLQAGFRSLPVFYGATFFINVISVVLDGPKLLYMDNIPTWLAVSISLVMGILAAILTQFVVVPMQKRKISKMMGTQNPVKFNFANSVESSPSCSPKKQRRPLSLISDNKQLPSIAEITELVSLSDAAAAASVNSPKAFQIIPGHLSGGQMIVNGNANGQVNANIIKKTEDLLAKVSLENVDLTVTSLNFIDEQQQNYPGDAEFGNVNDITSACDKKIPLEDHFKFGQDNNKPSNNNSRIMTNDAIETTTSKTTTIAAVNNIKNIESGTSLDLMMTSTSLSANSSKVPLIQSKETINDDDEPNNDNNGSHGGNGNPANPRCANGNSNSAGGGDNETPEISMLFSFLQILTATFGSFAHGGNDVSNAIGPLIALYMIYSEGSVLQKAESPIYILIYGGIGISVGLWLWGRRVIETIGNDLTKITSSTGFTIEVGAAITVLLASKIGLPISTTHCKVGSVVFVGHVSSSRTAHTCSHVEETMEGVKIELGHHNKASMSRAKSGHEPLALKEATAPITGVSTGEVATGIETAAVDWHLFRNIIYAWIVTVPVTALLSAAIMYLLCLGVLS